MGAPLEGPLGSTFKEPYWLSDGKERISELEGLDTEGPGTVGKAPAPESEVLSFILDLQPPHSVTLGKSLHLSGSTSVLTSVNFSLKVYPNPF